MSAENNFLVLGLDGTVISSGGDLQSDERFVQKSGSEGCRLLTLLVSRSAAIIYQLVKTASQGDLKAQRITVNYADHAYIICSSEKKIHVVKKRVAVPEIVA